MYLFILRWGTNFGKLLIKYLHKTNSDVKLSSGDYFRPKESVTSSSFGSWRVDSSKVDDFTNVVDIFYWNNGDSLKYINITHISFVLPLYYIANLGKGASIWKNFSYFKV